MLNETRIRATLGVEAFAAFCAEQSSVREADFHCALFDGEPDKALTVYVLRDPLTPDPYRHADGAVFYVGQTANPHRRFRNHVCPGASTNLGRRKRKRIIAIQRAGRSPRMELLNRVSSRSKALNVEKEWIEHFRNLGYALTNGGRQRRGNNFTHCLEPDGEAEKRTVFDLAQSGAEIMLQCLECCHLVWRDPSTLIANDFPPGMTVAEYRAHRRTCEQCGSGAIIAGVEEAGDMA